MTESASVDDIADVGSGLDRAGCGYVILIFFSGILTLGVSIKLIFF